METKTCTNCGQSKPLTDFTKAAGYRDGYKSWCKPCAHARNQDWRHRNPDKARAINNRSARRDDAAPIRKAWRNRIAEKTGKPFQQDYMHEWRQQKIAANPDFIWESHLRHQYKMSRERYDALLTKQGGACAICGGQNDDGRKLAVDHDHRCCPAEKKSCGRCVRGLLCARCNHMLGHAKDSTATLAKAISYLKQYQQEEN